MKKQASQRSEEETYGIYVLVLTDTYSLYITCASVESNSLAHNTLPVNMICRFFTLKDRLSSREKCPSNCLIPQIYANPNPTSLIISCFFHVPIYNKASNLITTPTSTISFQQSDNL